MIPHFSRNCKGFFEKSLPFPFFAPEDWRKGPFAGAGRGEVRSERPADDVVEDGLHVVDVVGFALQYRGVAHRYAHTAQGGDALVDLPLGAARHLGAAHHGLEDLAHQRLGLPAGFDLIQPGPDKAALQEAEHQGVRAQGFDDMVNDKDHLVGEAGKLGGVLLGSGTGVVQQLVAHPGQQGLRDRTLIGKIEVERALAHLGAGGDILHAGLGGAPLQKQLVSCIQKRAALFLFLSFHGAHSLLHPLF